MSARTSIARSPVRWFITIAFVFSYAAGITIQSLGTDWAAGSKWLAVYLHRLPIVMGPTVAAVVVACAVSGRTGLVNLSEMLLPRSVEWPYFVAIPVAGLTVTMFAAWITGETRHLGPLALAERWPVLIAHLCLQVALIGCLEELGWRGWLLRHMLKYQTRMVATASVASIWYVWHLPLILSGAKVAVALGLVVFALSILFTELIIRTQSVLLVALAHGSANTPHFFLADVVALKDPAELLLVSGFIYLVPAAVVVASWRRASLQRPPEIAA